MESEMDSEDWRDPERLADVVRRRVLRAMVRVVRTLDLVGRGQAGFRDDDHRRACVAMTRLASVLFGPPESRPHWGPGYHPSHTPEYAAQLYERLRSREQREEREEQEATKWRPLD